MSRVLQAGLITCVATLASAGPSAAQSAAAPPAATSPPLNIVVTIKPIHALAMAVLGDLGKAELLIDGAASPHTYALKPSQVRRLNEARAVIMVSDDLETFMRKVASSLPKSVAVVKLDGAPGMARLAVREGGLFEQDEHDHGHDHDHGGKKPGASSVPMDAHVWLDPENGKAMLGHLALVFSRLDPAHAAAFDRNARAHVEHLDQLQKALSQQLQPVAGKPFLVFHDAYQYFERRFGLAGIGSITLNPEVQPGAKRLNALRKKLVDGGAVCVFAEPQFEPKLVATLTEGTRVRKGTLDPIGTALSAGPDAYEKLLRGIADELQSCLGTAS